MDIPIYRWAALPRQTIFDGNLTRTALRTNDSVITFNWFGPETPRMEPHTHPFDQLIMVVYGKLNVEVDGQVHLLEPGTALRVPPNVPHTAWPAEKAEVLNIDVFAPIREDYLFLTKHQRDAFDNTYAYKQEIVGFTDCK
jgi:quercetin dioxygenase-like cupin family protein